MMALLITAHEMVVLYKPSHNRPASCFSVVSRANSTLVSWTYTSSIDLFHYKQVIKDSTEFNVVYVYGLSGVSKTHFVYFTLEFSGAPSNALVVLVIAIFFMKYGIWPIADEVNYELQKPKEWFHKVFSYYHTVTNFKFWRGVLRTMLWKRNINPSSHH